MGGWWETSKKSCLGGALAAQKTLVGRSAQAPLCPTLPLRQQELLFHFLQLVEGVEHHQQKFRSQGSVIDEIVDTAFEVSQAAPEERGQSGGTPEGQAWEACAQSAPNSHMGMCGGRQRPVPAQSPSLPTPRLEKKPSGSDPWMETVLGCRFQPLASCLRGGGGEVGG